MPMSPVEGQGKYGGTMRMIITSTQTNYGNPGKQGTSGRSLYTEPLALLDEKGGLVPWLATSWDMDPQAKTITLHLRKGVKFQDGTDMNAAAVKWSLEQAIVIGRISVAPDIDSLAVVDDSTLKINFKKFNALHLYAIVITVPIFSPTSLQVNGAEWAQTHGIGTGPFKLADMKSSSYANFTRFDNYWGPKPYLDGINQIVIADNSVASLTIQKKDADMWDTSGIKESQDLRNMGYQVIQRRAALAFLAWDSVHTNMPWANQKVREAIEYAIDRPGIAQARGSGPTSL